MYEPNTTGKCPHCGVSVRFELNTVVNDGASHGNRRRVMIQTSSRQYLLLQNSGCPHCGRPILFADESGVLGGESAPVRQIMWPRTIERPVSAEVVQESPGIAAEFQEAVAVLPVSETASAALARRCLQHVLTTKGGAGGRTLSDQIDEVLPNLPAAIAENIDAIRTVGNFAAHPIKSTSTGEIVEVEEGEAEWLLDVLEELFDFYYVQPARAAAKRAALNKKLADAGKPPLKTP